MDLSLRKCKDLDPSFFYPRNDKPGRATVKTQKQMEEEAAEFCNGCKIQQECINYAIAIREREGVWGATPERRREIEASRRHRIAV